MVGTIIGIVIIIWVFYSVSKNKNQGKPTEQGVHGRNMQNRQAGAPNRQAGAPNRQAGAPNRQAGAPNRQAGAPKSQATALKRQAATPDILQRAKASVEQEFSDNEAVPAAKPAESRQQRTKHKLQEQAGPAAQTVQKNRPADENRETAEGLLIAEEADSDLMKKVEELMVMGPDMKLTFSRDFVAEGVEMLNRISYSEPLE